MRPISVLQQNIGMSYLLSDDLGDAVRRRLREIAGLGLIALSVVAVAALATWSVRDPSFSHATSAPVRNLLGLPGAVTADLMMQLIGLASIALIAPIVAWGLRLMTHGLLCREPLRLGLWIVGTVIAAGFFACLPRTTGWPLPTGLGGVVGDLVLRAPAAVLGPLDSAIRIVIAIVLGCGALAAIGIASGLLLRTPSARSDRAERDEAAGAAISIGWLVHGLLSAKAQLARLVSGRRAAKPRPPVSRAAP